jgi:hypothetical protein
MRHMIHELMSICAVSAMADLATSYYSLQRHSDAVLLRENVLQLRQRVLPEGHPDIGK